MKKKFVAITFVLCLLVTLCTPIMAAGVNLTPTSTENSLVTLPCGHVQTEQFLDSEECVQCFEERIINERPTEHTPTPYGLLCPSCGRSSVVITCAKSCIVDKNNYQKGTTYLCEGCKNKTCNSSCYVLQYLSYALKKCNSCGYSSYLYNSSGTGLAKHYCGVYDYCSGNKYFIYCDLKGDNYEF